MVCSDPILRIITVKSTFGKISVAMAPWCKTSCVHRHDLGHVAFTALQAQIKSQRNLCYKRILAMGLICYLLLNNRVPYNTLYSQKYVDT